jgi:hypothetical protein
LLVLLFELLLMLMLDGQLALTMSRRLTVMVPRLLAVLTPLELPVEPVPLAMDPDCVPEAPVAPVLPVAEPLTPPVLLALVDGAEPLCGSVLALLEPAGELALAVVLVSGDVELLDGVDALAEVLGELEELLPRLAEVVSSVPWTFT